MRRLFLLLLSGLFYLLPAYAQNEPVLLFVSPGQCGYADWSPDGQWLVFTVETSSEQAGNLFLIPALGGEPTQLTENGGHHGVFSPDGRLIAYDGERGSVIRLTTATGGVAVRIVPETIPVEHSGNPCWSPDGQRITFRSGEELVILDLPSGTTERLLPLAGNLPMPIQWVGQDDSIVVSLINPESHEAKLWKIPVSGEPGRQLTYHDRVTQASISADARFIAYSATGEAGDYDLWIMPYTGGKALRLTDDPAHEVEPCWSPDGTRIAYASTKGEQFGLWVMIVDPGQIEAELATLNP